MAKFTVPPSVVVSVPKLPHDVMPDPSDNAEDVHVPVLARAANVKSSIYGNPVLFIVPPVEIETTVLMYLPNAEDGADPVVHETKLLQLEESDDVCVWNVMEFDKEEKDASDDSHALEESPVLKADDVNVPL